MVCGGHGRLCVEPGSELAGGRCHRCSCSHLDGLQNDATPECSLDASDCCCASDRWRSLCHPRHRRARVSQQGMEMLYLHWGPIQFDFETPPHIIEAISSTMQAGQTGYCPSEGTAEAKFSPAKPDKGIENPAHVFITTGASEAIELALTALLDPGDELLVPSRATPCTRHCCRNSLPKALHIPSMRPTDGNRMSRTWPD